MATPKTSLNSDAPSNPRQQIYVIVRVGRKPGIYLKGDRRLSDSIAWLHIAKTRVYDTKEEARAAFLKALDNGRVAKVSETVNRLRVVPQTYPPSPTSSELGFERLRGSGPAWVVFEGRDPGVFSHLSRRAKNVPGARYMRYTTWEEGERQFSEALDAGTVFQVVMVPEKTILQNTPEDLLLCTW